MIKEFYGFLWIKGTPEDIDNWLEEDGEGFAHQFYLEETNEDTLEDTYVSEKLDGFAPWFGHPDNEDGEVVRSYQLGESYWTADNKPLDIDKINSMTAIGDYFSCCFISVDKEDYDENQEDAKSITRSFIE